MFTFERKKLYLLTAFTIGAILHTTLAKDAESTRYISMNEMNEFLELYKNTEVVRGIASWLDTNFKYVVIAIGGTGNLLMLICMVFGRITNSVTLFICALSIFDNMVLIALVLQAVLEGSDWVYVQDWHCNLIYTWISFARQVGVWTVNLIALDRFIVLNFPFRATKLCSLKRGQLSIVGLIVIFFLINQHRLWGMEKYVDYNISGTPRGRRCVMNSKLFLASEWITQLFSYYIPLVVMLVLNILVIIRLSWIVKLRRTLTEQVTSSNSETRLTRMLIISTISYMSLNLPYVIVMSYRNYVESSLSIKDKYKFTMILVYLKCLMEASYGQNIFIFLIFGKVFRTTVAYFFVKLFHKINIFHLCEKKASPNDRVSTIQSRITINQYDAKL